ncbi:MAG: DUF2059 domain-containing protein [Hyphomicrobiaceae bacterium]
MRHMRLRVAAAFIAAATAFPATAQKAPDDAKRMTIARELLAITGAAKQFDVVMPRMMQQMAKIFIQQKPTHEKEIRDVFGKMLQRFVDRKQELIEQIADIYAKRLSAEDMAATVEFYKSPAGTRFVQALPEITKESFGAGQKWGQQIGSEIEREAREELKRRGIDL